MHRLFLRLLTIVFITLFALPALAQYTRDAAANKKIDEAINTHYLATDFDKAEAVLTGTIKACEDKCSPATLAKAWMYVGIVRGSGRNDQAGAKEAFSSALALDGSVKLDAGLATPETQATFAQVGGGGSVETPSTPATPEPAKGKKPPAAEGAQGNGLSCTPSVTEVETRRPIPVQCKSDEEVTSVELRYKPFGGETWKTVKMEHKGSSYRAQIPCDATQNAGTLKLYVHGKDAQGEDVVTWGSKSQPIEITLSEQTSAEPPSFDDADAPARCAAKEICPPDFPGCDSGAKSGGTIDWGGACNNSSECKSGLLCVDGTCETAPSCKTTADCPAGTCVDGKCAVEGEGPVSRAPKKWWFGLHVAQDLPFVGGNNICLGNSQTTGNWACYVSNSTDVPYDPNHFGTQAVGNVATGAVAGTTRILLSLDRALTTNVMVGVRAGYALRGGPPAGRQVAYTEAVSANTTYTKVLAPGKAFLPVHFEVKGSYWFGKNVLARRGIRPYVHVGGGLAQVDAKVVIKTQESTTPGQTLTADAWKKLGQGFIDVGGGAMYAFTPNWGIQLNLNAMYMLGASGFNLEPSLGAMFGF